DPILCSYNEGVSYPMASKDEITKQIIALRRPYERYADYAKSTIEDLFGAEAVSKAIKRQVYQFASVYLENLGNDQYAVRPLPSEVQYAPIYAIQPVDVDNDGNLDVILGGNFHSVSPSRGRYDASFGWYLKGDGKGGFQIQSPNESGLWLSGESRRFALLKANKQSPLLLVGRNNGPVGLWSLP
ncbi:MAG: RNA-binding protein, partial [Bacteroidota bacterium]